MRTLTLALNYKCDNACGFCFLGRERGLGLADTGEAELRRVFAANARSRRRGSLIISGAEATLRADLPELVGRALGEGGFSSVTLQTNGRRLADAAYCRRLIAAGVSEFQVSVHAADPATADLISGRAGSFAQTRRGLRNILAGGARLLTNTVVNALNYRRLRGLASFLAAEGVRECRFWSFLELAGAGQAKYQVRHSPALARLLPALETLREAGARVSLSWFPRCLLGRHARLLKNYSSPVVIHREFEKRMDGLGAFGCPHAGRCRHFRRSCLGLHAGYRAAFGDEKALLKPAR